MEGSIPFGLTYSEWQSFLKLTQHPTLWPLIIVAGEVGMEAAVTCCRTREVSEKARQKLAEARYDPSDLPSATLVDAALTGVRWRHRTLYSFRKRKRRPPLVETAQEIGVSLREVHEGIRALAALGWVDNHEAVGGIVHAYGH